MHPPTARLGAPIGTEPNPSRRGLLRPRLGLIRIGSRKDVVLFQGKDAILLAI